MLSLFLFLTIFICNSFTKDIVKHLRGDITPTQCSCYSHVTWLVIEDARLPDFGQDILFVNNTNLERLHIKRTTNFQLSRKTFAPLKNLWELSIEKNYGALTWLPADLLYDTEKLKWLWLYENSLTTLSRNFLRNVPKLEKLMCHSNLIEYLPRTLFSKNPALYQLSFLNNSLSSLLPGLFVNNGNLSLVSFSCNPLTSVDESFFDNTKIDYERFLEQGYCYGFSCQNSRDKHLSCVAKKTTTTTTTTTRRTTTTTTRRTTTVTTPKTREMGFSLICEKKCLDQKKSLEEYGFEECPLYELLKDCLLDCPKTTHRDRVIALNQNHILKSCSNPNSPNAVPALICGSPKTEPKISPPSLIVKVIGGEEARPHSWPWMASLRKNGAHHCGATLVSDRHILTAAHCFTEVERTVEDYQVVLGLHKRTDGGTPMRVRQIFVHPDYDRWGIVPENDIALIQLEMSVTITDTIAPICLPTANVLVNTECIVKGWGYNNSDGYHFVDKLKQASVKIYDFDFCNDADHHNGRANFDTMICAGYEQGGRDACQGDSGGPLVCQAYDGKWFQYGIVSWGVSCGRERKPGVYTRLFNYIHWIKEIME